MKTLLILSVLLLAACDKYDPYAKNETCSETWVNADPVKWERVFNSCMNHVAKVRAGRDYTANDDEDLDEVVKACRNAADASSQRVAVRTCVPVVNKDL